MVILRAIQTGSYLPALPQPVLLIVVRSNTPSLSVNPLLLGP